MTAFLFLCGAALLGVAVIRRVLRDLLDGAEQTLFGIVVGWILTTFCAYAVAYSLGRLSYWPMVVLALISWLAATWLWWPDVMRKWRDEPNKWQWPSKHAPLAALLSLFAPLYLYFFSIRMFQPKPDGLYSGGNSWNDMALHLAISSSFLHGHNFPPIYTPLYTPFEVYPLSYPFMPDFQTAILMALGLSPWVTLMATAVPLALIITGLLYCLARRMIRGAVPAALATILFLFNGGLGFLYFLEDWRNSKKGFVEMLSGLERNYANMWDRQLHWANIIADSFLPHRTSLYGYPVALMAFTLFAIVWRRWSESETEARWDGWRILLPAGVLVGLLPRFHTHSYMAIGLISGFLFLIRPRLVWVAFWLPAILLAAPQLLTVAGHVTSGEFMRLQPNWKGNQEASWLLYWIRNLGLPLFLIIPAWVSAPRPWRSFYLAFVCLMVFSVTVMVSPHDYDNIKLMYYWYAISCILIAAWLVKLASEYKQRLLVVLLVLACTASGLLSLQRERLIR